jgi:regulator of sigma E protease
MSSLAGNPWVLMAPAFILVISIIVVIHEMGHYLVGRWCGIRIMAFSLGFGPELVGFTDRHGTRWKVSAVPLGGYVRFYGDEDASSRPDFETVEELPPEERAKTFLGAKLWKRAATVAAGPIANFLLSIFILTMIFMTVGRYVMDPVVTGVEKESPAAVAGVQKGDLILAADGWSIETFDDLVRYVTARPDIPIVLTVKRADKNISLRVVPKVMKREDPFGNKIDVPTIGVQASPADGNRHLIRYSPLGAVAQATVETWNIVTGTVDYIGNLLTARLKPDQIGGPIRVAQVSGQVATLGFVPLMSLAALLSVSIGLLNLMPIPVLDGGHLLFYAIEALRGRPLGEMAQGVAFRVGLALVLCLMVFATWNDIAASLG